MSKTFLYTDSYGDVYKSKKDGELYLIKIIKADRLKFKKGCIQCGIGRIPYFFTNK